MKPVPVSHPIDFTTRIRRAPPVNGVRGWDVEASDHRGFVVAGVWTAGSRQDAEQEATRLVTELRAKAASKTRAA